MYDLPKVTIVAAMVSALLVAAETSRATLNGATNITAGNVPNSVFEQETAMDTLGDKVVVAFNYGDAAHESGGNLCYGLTLESLAFASTSDLGTWTIVALPVPNGTAALLGDPGVVGAFRDGSTLSFFVSSMATSNARWNSLATSGCVPSSLQNTLQLNDQVCVWRADFTLGSNAAPVVTSPYPCVGPSYSGDNIDGTNIATDGASIYVTYNNASESSAEVFADGNRLPTPPFTTGVVNHPIFAKGAVDGGIVVIAPDDLNNFYATQYIGPGWSSVIQIASATENKKDAFLGNGASIRDIGYAATWFFPPTSDPRLEFVYQTLTSAGKVGLAYSTCLASPWGDCGSFGLFTDANANSFMPSLATVVIPLPPPDPYYTTDTWLTYWSDSGRTDGSLDMKLVGLTNGMTVQEADGANTEVPCPNNDYWGDYDESIFVGNNTSSPVLLRPFTDSTGATCNGGGVPMHVSLFTNHGLQ